MAARRLASIAALPYAMLDRSLSPPPGKVACGRQTPEWWRGSVDAATVGIGTGPKTSAPQQVGQLFRGTTDGDLNAVDLPGLTSTLKLSRDLRADRRMRWEARPPRSCEGVEPPKRRGAQ